MIAIATTGAALNLGLVAAARGLRTAAPLRVALYVLANVAFVSVVAAVIDSSRWTQALVLAPVMVAAAVLLRAWNAPGRVAFALLVAAAASYVAYVFSITFLSGLGALATLFSGVLLIFEFLALALTLVYVYEGFSVLGRVRWKRRVTQPPAFDPAYAPFVSIHIPTYSEPPALVIETLNALAAVDYPSFEVLVIDNNTKDASLWQPVQRRCAELGERFRFFHVDPLAGFKAGACNFALTKMDPRTELVAIIDADYMVDPAFLREVTPHFRDPQLAFVQTPQDYREFAGNRFLTDCLHAYAYFFAVSMVARNEDDASIFGGTMGILRRSVLEEIGGWDEWCITEDAEASLRILRLGYHSLYVPKAYGHGLMPFDFDSYKKQRFRWAFGGIQIFRKHWRSLLPFWPRPVGDRLTRAQRFWYLMAAFLWFGEPLQIAFGVFLFLGALAYAFGGLVIARPVTEATLLFPLIFLVLGIARFLWILRASLRLSLGGAIGAAISMFSLSFVVSQAVAAALVHGDGVFLRTSKTRAQGTVLRALASSRWETAGAAICLAVAISILARGFAPLGIALAALCLWQTFIYGSAFVTSLSAIRSARLDARPAHYRRTEPATPLRAMVLFPATVALATIALFVALAGVAVAPGVAQQLNDAAVQQAPLLPEVILATPTPGPTRTAAPIPGAPAASARPAVGTGSFVPATPSVSPTATATPTTRPTPPVAQPTPPATRPTPPSTQPTPPGSQPTPAGGPPSSIPTPRSSAQSLPSQAR